MGEPDAAKRHKSEWEKQTIRNVHEWVREAVTRERCEEAVFPRKNAAVITAEMCGVSRSDVFRIRKRYENNADYVHNVERRGRDRINFDDFDKKALASLVLGYYRRTPPELPTLEKIYIESQLLPGFPACSKTTVYRLMKKLGFVCKARNTKMLVYQRADVVAQRHRVLRSLVDYRATNFEIYYQDETWCNANHTRKYVWQVENTEEEEPDTLLQGTQWQGGLKVPCGAGKRLIINNIGSKNGFLMGCGEVFIGKKDSGDYHTEMNHMHFENWWKDKVLPMLPDRSVVVIDNASYHTRQTDDSKTPTTAWKKNDIQVWLTKKGKAFREKDTKPILLQLSKEVFVKKQYVLETITEEYCVASKKEIIILRLPVGHSELNAIELIWAQTKNEVARRNVKFNITAVKQLMEEALSHVTPQNWKAVINRVEKVEAVFRKLDFGDEDTAPQVDKIIIELGGESDSDLSDDCYYDDE